MSRFHPTHPTPDNNSGPAAPMEHHVVNRILASLLLATCAISANAENLAPTVAITAPADSATIVAPTVVTLTAEAADSDGAIAKVEFFSGATLVATVTQAPYTYVWNAVTPGSYAFTAKATDDLALTTTSAVRAVTVAAPPGAAKPFFIFSDQINTTREITNSAGAKVWQADPEPFGANLPNENPAGQGTFVYNPRFPGQYYDRETGLHYNYHRDYDPQTGRYIQSDPIGLNAGINTYGYVLGNPLKWIDRLGLANGSVAASMSKPKGPYRGDGPIESGSQVVAVGLLDAIRAQRDASSAEFAAATSGLNGMTNGPQDAYRHCIWSCLMTQNIGAGQAKTVGDIHELQGTKAGQPANERAMDEKNNAVGRTCAQQKDGLNCAERCMDALDDGRLQPGLLP